MFIKLYKLVVPFLFPPGCAIVLGLALWLLIVRCCKKSRCKKLIIWLMLCQLVGLYFLSSEIGKNTICRPLEKRFAGLSPTDLARAKAIVVLGGGIITHIPGNLAGPNSSMLTATAMCRVVEAARLFREQRKLMPTRPPLYIVLSSGRLRDTAPAEAEIARDLLLGLGIPDEYIITEANSRTTYENARYSIAICRERQLEPVILLTSALHLPRAAAVFNRLGLTVIPCASDYVAGGCGYRLQSFVPKASHLFHSSRGLWEYVGMAYYRLAANPSMEKLPVD